MTKTTNYAEVVKVLRKATARTKITAVERKTGITFMEGGDRLCKVVLNKDLDLINLEVNVKIDYEAFEYQHITYEEAYKKHLGTMKGRLKTRNLEQAKEVINLALAAFKTR